MSKRPLAHRLKKRYAYCRLAVLARFRNLYVLSSFQRSGTHWLKFLISHVLGQEPLETRLLERDKLLYALYHEASVRLCYDHFDYELHGDILNTWRFPRLKMVLLYRHPLDALVSQFYIRAQRNALMDPSLSPMENLKLYIRGKTPWDKNKKQLINYWPMFGLRPYLQSYITDWLKHRKVLPVRYENLLTDTAEELKKVLDFMQVPYTDEKIAEAIQKRSFETFTGGRSRGVEDKAHHYRKGMSGDWKNVFDDEDLAVIRREIGDLLDFLNYSIER